MGKRIRDARLKLTERLGQKVTQECLAQMCGWESAQSRVNKYELGERTPSLEDFVLLAEATCTTPEWLAFGAGSSGSSGEPLTQDNEFGKSALEAAEWVQRTPSLEIQAQLAQGVKEQALIYIREKEKEAIAEAEKYRRIRELHDENNTTSENSSGQNGLRSDAGNPSPEDIEGD